MTKRKSPGSGDEATFISSELLDLLPAGAVLTNPDGAIVSINEPMARLLGASPSVLVGRSIDALAGLEAGEADPAGVRVETPMLVLRPHAGEPIPVTARGATFRDGGATARGLLYVAATPDPHLIAEETYRNLFEAAHDAIIVFEPEHERILDVNQRAFEVYGFTREEFLGMSLESISTDVTLGKTRIAALLSGGGRMNFEVVHLRKDGTQVYVDVNTSPVLYDGKRAILSVNRDVTLRKRAEIQAKESEARLQAQSRMVVELARDPLLHGGDLLPALRRLTEESVRILDCQRAGVWLIDEQRGVLATVDLFDVAKGHTLDRDLPLAEYPLYVRALETERCIAAADASLDERTAEFAEVYFIPHRVLSTIDAPIRHAGKLIGVLCCEVIGSTRTWSVDEELFASSMADLAGLAVAAADRKATADALRRRVEFETLITSISTEFVTTPLADIGNAIQHALGRIAGFENTDRAYVCVATESGEAVAESYEWSRDGSTPVVAVLREHGPEVMEWWARKMYAFETISIPDVTQLPAEAAAEREIIEPDARSVIAVPMTFGGALVGLIAFESIERRDWNDGTTALLKMVGEIIASALERKRREGALGASERLFRTLIERMNEGVLKVTCSDEIVFVNDRFCELLGYSREELVGQTAVDFLVATEESRALMRGQLALRDRKISDQYEVEMRRKNGELRWFSISGAPVFGSSGEVGGSLGVVADITERRRAQEQFKQTISVLQSTLDSTGDGILVVDHTGRIVTYNTRFLQLWRLGANAMPEWIDELLSRVMVDQVRDPMPFLARTRELRHKPTADSFDQLELSDGRVYERYSVPQRIDGVPVGRVWSFRDATETHRAQDALAASEQRYRLLFERNLAGVYRNTLDGRILDANEACARMFGFETREQFLSRAAAEFYFDGEDRTKMVDDLKQKGTLTNYEVCLCRRDGRSFWALENMTLIYDESGEPAEIEGTLIDISDRKRIDEALRESEERYRLMAENSTDIISRHTVEGIFLYASPASKALLGYEPEELVGTSLADLTDPEHRERVTELQQSWESGHTPPSLTYRIRNRDGLYLWFETTSRPLRNEETGQLLEIIAVSRDVTERKVAEERIEYQAFHDALTALPNRLLFKDRLTVALAHGRRAETRLAVMFLDLDQFKYVNDTLGHSAGDHLLVEIADRLRRAVREEDTVSRLGGDEFTLLLVDVATEEAVVRVAQKILRAVERPMVIDGHELSVTTSIGVALFPNDGEDAETLLKNADAAMYRAKEAGRNTFHLSAPSMERRTLDRLAVERQLRRAVERQEFVLHYQPQVSLADDRIIGLEALVRWNHPERGLVPPLEFIGVAEESRLILPLGEWVLREACRQLRAWHRAGYDSLRVAVNLSARQFQQADLVEVVSTALRDTRLDPKSLELEITESTAMQNTDWTRSVLDDLKAMGISIAMDDFGTGHSSLNYLKRFPIDCVKIDRDFISDVTRDESNAAIVAALITMARVMRLRVIAEGVERQEQLVYLRERECDVVQGFFISGPVPPEEVERMLLEERERETEAAEPKPSRPWIHA